MYTPRQISATEFFGLMRLIYGMNFFGARLHCYYDASLRRTLVRLCKMRQGAALLIKDMQYKCATQQQLIHALQSGTKNKTRNDDCGLYNYSRVSILLQQAAQRQHDR